jgi:hypothetical protein
LQPLFPKTGGWGGLAQVISDLARRTHRFFSPLFSWSYKSLFQQLPCFHIYTKRGGVFCFVDGIRGPAFPNQESSRRSYEFSAPACRRQACPPPAGLSVIFYSSDFPSPSNLSTFNFQLSTVDRPHSSASSEPFKPFNFQLSTVNRPSPQLECL